MSNESKQLASGAATRGVQDSPSAEVETALVELLARLDTDLAAFEHLRHGLSHDLRAPLRSMHSFAMILERRYADSLDEKGRDFLHRIVAAGERADTMLDELVSYVREQSRQPSIAEPAEAVEPAPDAEPAPATGGPTRHGDRVGRLLRNLAVLTSPAAPATAK